MELTPHPPLSIAQATRAHLIRLFFGFSSSSSGIPEAGEEVLDVLDGLGIPALGLGHELDGALAGALPVLGEDEVRVLDLGELVEDAGDEALGVLDVGLHVAEDEGDVDVLERVPAVVVGGHADALVGHLGLAGELGLGEGGHVDDGAAPGAVHVRLGAG